MVVIAFACLYIMVYYAPMNMPILHVIIILHEGQYKLVWVL